MDEVVARYVALFAELEARQKEQAATGGEAPARAGMGIAPAGPAWAAGARWRSRTARRSSAVLSSTSGSGRSCEQLKGAIDRLNATEPSAPARAMVMEDAPKPVEPHVFLRGNPGRPGKAVPRRFLRVLAGPEPPPFKKGSGRLELARAIADPKNPLTARVLVNRVWHWHFGKGLVTTPSDFGLRSDPPSHPELLDSLAAGFIADGWSIKALHRRIMLSNTYRQASAPRPDAAERDPENRLVWRFNPQRLDFESMRDSILAASGALEPIVGGRPVTITEPPFAPRRTVYGFIDRQNLDGLYRTFDFAVPDATSPRRFVTTVPQQALFLMNSPFLHDQARRAGRGDPPGRLVRPDRRHPRGSTVASCSGPPEPDELALAQEFLRRQSGTPAPPTAGSGWSPGKAGGSLSPWEQLAQVLMLTNEFISWSEECHHVVASSASAGRLGR